MAAICLHTLDRNRIVPPIGASVTSAAAATVAVILNKRHVCWGLAPTLAPSAAQLPRPVRPNDMCVKRRRYKWSIMENVMTDCSYHAHTHIHTRTRLWDSVVAADVNAICNIFVGFYELTMISFLVCLTTKQSLHLSLAVRRLLRLTVWLYLPHGLDQTQKIPI